MSTQKETIEFLLNKLGNHTAFTVRAMFGEYAIYANGKVVGLVCNDLIYIKILPESQALESICETGEPYRGAKPYYIVEERHLLELQELPTILLNIAKSLPIKKKP
jgi:TfoX/Sxy family transcriptional regulator of competence genes